jgi:hypothetical protein
MTAAGLLCTPRPSRVRRQQTGIDTPNGALSGKAFVETRNERHEERLARRQMDPVDKLRAAGFP